MTPIRRLSRRLHGFPVELPAALLAAVAVGFWLLLAPGPWFQQTAGPSVLTARLLLALAGSALTFALTRAGLRALEPRRAAPADMPQFRKADLHPDAPRRRPIRADREFGAPDFGTIIAPPTPRLARDATVSLPSFLQPAASGPLDEEPIRFVDDIVRDVPEGVFVAREPVWFRPRDPHQADEDDWEDADWEEASDDLPAPEPTGQAEVRTEPAPASDAAAPPTAPVPPVYMDENVVRLMARLEAGLARRGNAPVRPVRNENARAALRAVADELDAIFSADLSPRTEAAQ